MWIKINPHEYKFERNYFPIQSSALRLWHLPYNPCCTYRRQPTSHVEPWTSVSVEYSILPAPIGPHNHTGDEIFIDAWWWSRKCVWWFWYGAPRVFGTRSGMSMGGSLYSKSGLGIEMWGCVYVHPDGSGESIPDGDFHDISCSCTSPHYRTN